MSRPLVLGCSATKLPGRLPAMEKYDGPFWKTLRAHLHDDRPVYVLSAKHGLIPASTVIGDYDLRLVPTTTRYPKNNEVLAGEIAPLLRTQAQKLGLRHVDLVAGVAYAEALRIAGIQAHKIGPPGGGIGEQRKALKALLATGSANTSAAWLPTQAWTEGKLRFDPVLGMGAVSDLAKIRTLGWIAWMKPSQFLALNPPIHESPSSATKVQAIRDLLRRGEATAPAFLIVNPPIHPNAWMVRSHEGRHRMTAIQALNGDAPVPVYVLMRIGTISGRLSKDLHAATFVPDARTWDGVALGQAVKRAVSPTRTWVRGTLKNHTKTA